MNPGENVTVREKVNILLVDDQPAKLMSLEAILADLGENLIMANSADEALRYLLSEEIAIVLVDVCMPKMDGFELAELVRQHPRFERTAIIFISAVHLTDADRLRGYHLGAVDYIPVPIIPQVLRAKVAVFAELFRKTKQLEAVNAELKERVAELDRSNERLRFADRMATIGTLAAGLGHDMGNLLLPVRLRLDTLEACDLPPAAREDVAAIRKGTEYLKRLAANLRLLSLDSQETTDAECATCLSDWWQETEGMIRNGVPRSVSLSSTIPADLPHARIDKSVLTQIAFNLVQNAGDALKGRADGRVVVAARTTPAGDGLWLSVTDNGPGLEEEAKRRCLEPFFTTKTRGVSTGLGLALVAGLVKRAQGALHIESEPGRGAVFRLELRTAPSAKVTEPLHAHKPLAVVSLKDARLAAHVRSVLASLDYEVRADTPAGADVWVTEDENDDVPRMARLFLEESPHRRAVIFGVPEQRSHLFASPGPNTPPADAPPPPRLLCLQATTRLSQVRSQLQNLLTIESKKPRSSHDAGTTHQAAPSVCR
jgi:signal transduction histidine kinase